MLTVNSNLKVSFEFFPPKNQKMVQILWESIKRIEPLNPQFVSVTYGARGSTRNLTHELVKKIKVKTDLEPAAHLTCVGSSIEEIEEIATNYWNDGIKHIVALRGDLPDISSKHREIKYATDLIKVLKKNNDFQISVSAYPEGHPESKNLEENFDTLKKKIDLGATKAITQFFFDNKVFLDFLENARKRNINIPIIPGILPVSNCKKTLEFCSSMNCKVPNWIKETFVGLDSDPETRKLVAATIASEQCKGLLDEGINEFHFYTLNRTDLSFAICHILGIRSLKD